MTQPLPALEFEDEFASGAAPLPWAVPEATSPGAWAAFSVSEVLGDGALAIPNLGSALASALESVAMSSPWAFAHGMALVQWLQNYTPPSSAPLDQVQGWLEAFYHACEAELWPLAQAIAQAHPQTDQPLYRQLGQWGHCREQVELCEALIPQFDPPLRGELQQIAGDGQRRLGNQDTARRHYESLLQTGQASGDRLQMLKARLGLAHLDAHFCYHQRASEQLVNLLPEAEALGDAAITVEILRQLAVSYGYTGRAVQGGVLVQRALDLVQTHGLKDLEVPTLQALIKVYEWQGQTQRAMPHLNRILVVAQAQQNLALEADAHTRLGRAHFSRRRFSEAIAHGERSLVLYRQIHHRDLEIIALNDLGSFYAYGLGQCSTALDYFQQAQALARQLGGVSFMAVPIANQAYCHALLGQQALARQTSAMALTLASQNDTIDDDLRMVVYAVLGRVHWVEGRYFKAFALVWQALCIAPPWRSINGKLVLAKAWDTLRQWPQHWWRLRFGRG